MKKIFQLGSIVLLMFMNSCSIANKPTSVWINKEKLNGKSFNKVLIVVMTADIEARNRLESDLVLAVTAKGYHAFKSLDLLPPSLNNSLVPEKEEILRKVKASNCDAVFVSSLLKKEEDIHYVPGTTSYSPLPYYNWSGNFYRYYRHWYPTVYQPSYYQKDKTYFMQGNLYDADSEELMWSVQSEIFNPSSLEKFSKVYTATLVKQLEKENLLKK